MKRKCIDGAIMKQTFPKLLSNKEMSAAGKYKNFDWPYNNALQKRRSSLFVLENWRPITLLNSVS